MKIFKSKKEFFLMLVIMGSVIVTGFLQSCSDKTDLMMPNEVGINSNKMTLDNFLESMVTNKNIYDNSNTIYIQVSKNLVLSINKKTLTHGNIRLKSVNPETVKAGWTYWGEIHGILDANKANNALKGYSCVEVRFESQTIEKTNIFGVKTEDTFTNMYYRACK